MSPRDSVNLNRFYGSWQKTCVEVHLALFWDNGVHFVIIPIINKVIIYNLFSTWKFFLWSLNYYTSTIKNVAFFIRDQDIRVDWSWKLSVIHHLVTLTDHLQHVQAKWNTRTTQVFSSTHLIIWRKQSIFNQKTGFVLARQEDKT